MDKTELISFSSREAMAKRIADLVETAMCGGEHDIALSGGSTPKALYEELATRDIDWSSVNAVLVDERWVPPQHPRSNEAFARAAFAAADGFRLTGLYRNDGSPKDATAALSERFQGAPADVVILGMGDDGHTASWFPHADGLDAALKSNDAFCAVTAVKSAATGEEVERVTMTLAAIAQAKLIILMITGEEKRATFERAREDGPVEDMPVRAILRARPDLWASWAP